MMSQVQVNVIVSRRFRVRLWIAVQLIRVAAWVAGFGGVVVRSE